MKKRLVGICLTLLSIALWLGPIAFAFGSHSWSVEKTVLPKEEQINEIEDRVKELMGNNDLSEGNFSITESSISGEDISLTIKFSSPFPYDIEVKELSVVLHDGQKDLNFASIELTDNAKIEKGSTGYLNLSGHLTDEGREYESLPSNVGFSEGTFRFKASKVTIELTFEQESAPGATTKESPNV